jgi:hypothetical protein
VIVPDLLLVISDLTNLSSGSATEPVKIKGEKNEIHRNLSLFGDILS